MAVPSKFELWDLPSLAPIPFDNFQTSDYNVGQNPNIQDGLLELVPSSSYSKVKFTYSPKPRYVILHIANHDIVMVCVITYFNYITTHTFPLGSEKGMSYYIFTMVCPNTEYVLLSILSLDNK